MKISKIIVKNFRSIKHQELIIGDHNVFLGENNSGKSNLIDAIRYFYDEIKINEDDFYNNENGNLSIEIEFSLTGASKSFFSEQKGSKYILDGDIIRVKKDAIKNDSEIIENGRHGVLVETEEYDLDNKFFGFKGVSKSLLADIIYIAPLKKIEDELRTTNQSTTMMKIMRQIVGSKIEEDSDFKKLNQSISDINIKKFFENIESDLSQMMKGYDCNVQFIFDKMSSSDVISKASVKLQESDGTKAMDISSKGHGTQRALLINLLRYWAQKEISEKVDNESDQISPTIILIEEPEIFQHPQKQEMLFVELKELSKELNTQVFINTHSSHFVIQDDTDILSLFKTKKEGKQTFFSQLKEGGDAFQESKKSSRFKFHKWLNGERNKIFFASKIVLCEGYTEKMLIDYLLDEKFDSDYASRSFYSSMDCGGKFKLPHWIRLCEELGINYYLLYDLDNNKNQDQKDINNIIENFKKDSKYILGEYVTNDDIEKELFGEKAKDHDEKMLIVERIENGDGNKEVIENIKNIF